MQSKFGAFYRSVTTPHPVYFHWSKFNFAARPGFILALNSKDYCDFFCKDFGLETWNHNVKLKVHLAFILCRLNDSEIERHHFKDQDMYSDKSDKENDHEHDESDNDGLGKSEESDSDTSERQDDSYVDPEPIDIKETTYLEQSHEELGEVKVLFM